VILVTVTVAWLWTSRQSPTYQASTSLVVTPNTEVEDITDLLRSLETLERRTVVATFARLPGSPETADSVAERLGVEPREIRHYWIGGAVVPNTNIVRIDVYGPDPERAAEVANATARVVRREARHLYQIYSLYEMARAEPPSRPVRPDARRNAVVAAILGVFLGVLAALGLEAVRSRRSP
jgi:capsular polysaccharide biosynthesis protein